MSALYRVYAPEECGPDGYPFAWAKCPRCEGHGWLASANGRGHPQGSCRQPITTATMELDGFEATCCDSLDGCPLCETAGSVKHLVRQQADHRCVRCRHPFKVGESGEMVGPSAETKAFAADLGMSVETFDQMVLENSEGDHGLPPEKELAILDNARRVNWSDCDGECRHGGPIRYFALGMESDWNHYDGPETANAQGFYTDQYSVQAAWRILTVHHLNERKEDLRWHNLVALCQRCLATLRSRAASVWSRSIPSSTLPGSSPTRLAFTPPLTWGKS